MMTEIEANSIFQLGGFRDDWGRLEFGLKLLSLDLILPGNDSFPRYSQ